MFIIKKLIMEKYLDWIINENNVATGFFESDGVVKLEAKIYPNIKALYNFLKDNGIVSSPCSYLIEKAKISMFGNSYLRLTYSEETDLKILNSIANFCQKETYQTTKSAHAFLSIGSTGSRNTEKRAMNKIKEWIRDSLPNPRKKLIEYLKSERLISTNTNIFCEILSKDI